MISRISCFNRAIFRRSLRRTAPLWVVYLIFWVIALPLQLLIGFSRVRYEVSDLQSAILTAAQMGSSFVCFLYGAACAWLIFYWLFRSRSAYFYASLPVRRETVFVTDYCAGLVVGLVPNVAVFLLSLGATAMETSGHGALKENFFLDDGAYLVTKLLIELARGRDEGYTLHSLIADLAEPAESREFRMSLFTLRTKQ